MIFSLISLENCSLKTSGNRLFSTCLSATRLPLDPLVRLASAAFQPFTESGLFPLITFPILTTRLDFYRFLQSWLHNCNKTVPGFDNTGLRPSPPVNGKYYAVPGLRVFDSFIEIAFLKKEEINK